MHRQARRRLTERHRGGYGAGTSPGGAMGGGGYNDGPGGSTLDSATPQGGYDGDTAPDPFSAYAARVRQIESGGDPNAVTGHNYGLFQFGPEEMRKYGITDWRNPAQQYSGLQQEYAEHSRLLTQSGLPATPENLYLMHQQGVGGAPALLQANPNTPAWQVLRRFYPSDAVAQKAIMGNIPGNNPLHGANPNDVTAGQFVNLWQAKYGGQPMGDVGTQTAGVPTNPQSAENPPGSRIANAQTAGFLGNPMEMVTSLLGKDPMGQQNAPPPGFAPPGGVARLPQVNPQVTQQQQALLQGILHPQFQKLDA